jgi:ABC-type Zn uptake system ZnuABC Zn-binding protein ZnuA
MMWKCKGLQGISTASEVSLRDVQRIVNSLTTRRIKAIFVESSVSSRSIEAVCKAVVPKATTCALAARFIPTQWAPAARRRHL